MITNVEEILTNTKLLSLFEAYSFPLKKKGASFETNCWSCDGKIQISPVKNIAKCFKCNESYNAVAICAHAENLDPVSDFPKIIEIIANKTQQQTIIKNDGKRKPTKPGGKKPGKVHQQLEVQGTDNPGSGKPVENDTGSDAGTQPAGQPPEPTQPAKPNQRNHIKKTFRDIQLAASGITEEAQRTKIADPDGKTTRELDRFESKSRDAAGNLIVGDDMIIHYVTLSRQIATYYKTNKKTGEAYGKPIPLHRVRWQFPEQHPDKHGKPIKYQSPADSGCPIYLPEALLSRFERRIPTEILHIDEGEKKAEKKTMHKMFSTGIMGIQNMGKNGQLNSDYGLLIKTLSVKNVIFTVDADWLDLPHSSNNVDSRAYQFKAAVTNYKNYFYAFVNQNIELKIFFAYVRSEHNQKGVDDLLVHVLPGKEKELLDDYQYAMNNQPSGEGKYINCIDITGYSEQKLKELFKLESKEKFIEYHKDALIELKEFTFGNTKFRINEEGEVELAQPLTNDEIFWKAIKGRGRTSFEIYYDKLDTFLNNRFIGRKDTTAKNADKATYRLLRAYPDTKTVEYVEAWQIRDFVMGFLKDNSEYELYNFLRGFKQPLKAETIEETPYIDNKITFLTNKLDTQYMFFTNGFWEINPLGISTKTINDSQGYVWKENVTDFSSKLLDEPLLTVHRVDGEYTVTHSPEAKNAHFLQYLINTSNFHWAKKPEDLTPEQIQKNDKENMLHFLNKMSAFGYALHQYFDPNNAKAVICMDGKLSEVGASFGRSGKSLLLEAIRTLRSHKEINGKKEDIATDKYLLSGVTEKTSVITVDDTRINFDFETLYNFIVGGVKVRNMHEAEKTIAKEFTQKIIIATNHAIKSESDSDADRQFLTIFSDFYNRNHRPIHDFKFRFFDDWEWEQYNYFYNTAAVAIHIFLRFGLIECPNENAKLRILRQDIGEAFIKFMDEYFEGNDDRLRFDEKLPRIVMFQAFIEANPRQKTYVNAHKFREKFIKWCQLNRYIFNPNIPTHRTNERTKEKEIAAPHGGKYTTGSTEYFIVGRPTDQQAMIFSNTPDTDDYEDPDISIEPLKGEDLF